MRFGLLMGLLIWAQALWAAELLLSALVDGQVVRQVAAVGQSVKKGQLLLVIDPARWRAQREALQARVAQRRAELEDATLDLREAQDLYDRTVLAKRQLQRRELVHARAQAALTEAQAALKAHEAMRRYYWVRAPRAGRLKTLHAPAGKVVYRGSPLLVLEVKECLIVSALR